ncbi:MAG: hypothetical protein ACLT5P_03720 [Flavonifractor plautii]
MGWYFLLAAAGLDLLLPFLLAPFDPGFSHRRQVMSVLGSPESPVRWVYGCGWWRWGCFCAPPHQTYGLPLETAPLS